MSKRNIESSNTDSIHHKKNKSSPPPSTTQEEISNIQCIPDDVWSQQIFSFLNGHELFNNQRLVCSLWNDRVLSTRHCSMTVSLNDEESSSKFIENARIFQNIVGLSVKSKVKLSNNIGKLANVEWKCLKSLELRDVGLTDEDAKHLANGNLQDLTLLDLSNNLLSDIGIEYLSSGNITKLTTLKIYSNNIKKPIDKYFINGNLKNLTTLNHQTLGKQGDNKFLAMTDHFTHDTPFRVHIFDTIEEFTEYIFEYYLDHWSNYGGRSLGIEKTAKVLKTIGEIDDDEDSDPDEPLLRKAVFGLPLGKMFGMAVGEVGDMVFNECETEAIVSLIYGQVLTKELFCNADESTPFAILAKKDGYLHNTYQIIGKSKFLQHMENFMEEEEEEDEQDKEDPKVRDSKLFKSIAFLVSVGEYAQTGIQSICVGESLSNQFVLLK